MTYNPASAADSSCFSFMSYSSNRRADGHQCGSNLACLDLPKILNRFLWRTGRDNTARVPVRKKMSGSILSRPARLRNPQNTQRRGTETPFHGIHINEPPRVSAWVFFWVSSQSFCRFSPGSSGFSAHALGRTV
jgi:hypothetical protein